MIEKESKLKVIFKYEHGSADKGLLNIYDASVALNGISRTLFLITHAYINGEVRKQGDIAHGAEIYINTPKKGSFIYEAIIYFGGVVSSGVFYDFLKYALNEAVGKLDSVESYPKSLADRIEPTIGELPAILESPLYDVHRPIRKDKDMTLKVMRPRGEILANFDKETSDYLLPKTVNITNTIIGNVTKYSAISGWGRFYDRQEKRTIPFRIQPTHSDRERSLITWSLHEHNMKREATLYVTAQAVVAPSGKIKRYIFDKISNTP